MPKGLNAGLLSRNFPLVMIGQKGKPPPPTWACVALFFPVGQFRKGEWHARRGRKLIQGIRKGRPKISGTQVWVSWRWFWSFWRNATECGSGEGKRREQEKHRTITAPLLTTTTTLPPPPAPNLTPPHRTTRENHHPLVKGRIAEHWLWKMAQNYTTMMRASLSCLFFSLRRSRGIIQ
jgi:hypothetical protein